MTGRARPVEVLHLLGSGQRKATAVARVVEALGALSDPTRYRFSAWFLHEGGPLQDDLETAGVTTAVVPWGRRADPRSAARLARALRGRDVAVVHRHVGGRAVGAVLRGATRARVVTHLHGLPEQGGRPPGSRLRPGTDLVVVNSTALADLPTSLPVRVVHPGVLVPPVATGPRVDGPPTIGAACRLVPVKGVRTLLDAVALMRPARPDLRVEIAGDGPLRASLADHARRLGIGDCVRFVGWQDDVADLLARCSVFAQPSIQEGFGLAALEAMAAGVPVVATTVGGVRDLVVHGRTGFLVPAADPVALADRLSTVVDDAALRRRLGAAARDRAAAAFSREAMVQRLEDVYEELVGGRARMPLPRRAVPPPAPTGGSRAAPGSGAAPAPPRSSLVVATRLRAEPLDRCLGAVERLPTRPDEVVVVDNSTGDPATRAVARAHGAAYVVEPRPGLSRARNLGAHQASGEVVVFLDDDALPREGWLTALLSPFADHSVSVVTGRIVPETADPAAHVVTEPYLDAGPERRRIDRSTRCWFEMANFGGVGNGGNMALRRCLFDAWPGFRASLGLGTPGAGGEEHYAFFELVRAGHRAEYSPAAVVTHPTPATKAGAREREREVLSQAAAYAVMLLVEEPGYRGRTLRFLGRVAQGRGRPWEDTSRRSSPRLLSRAAAARAILAGPLLYVRARRATTRQ